MVAASTFLAVVVLYLHFNKHTGGIPTNIGQCTTLQRLYLCDDQLSGVVAQVGADVVTSVASKITTADRFEAAHQYMHSVGAGVNGSGNRGLIRGVCHCATIGPSIS